MAITAVYTTGAVGGSTTGNFTLTPPNSSAAVGDVAVIGVAERVNVEAISSIADTSTGTKTFTKLRFGAQSATVSTGIWYRVLASGDPGVGNTNTWTVTCSGGKAEGALAVYTGVDTTTPVDAQGTTNTGAASPSTINAVTTTMANAMYIGVVGVATGVAPLSAQTSGSPTLTSRAGGGNGGNTTTRAAVGLIDGIIASAGSSGSFAWSLASSTTWSSDSFALRPASAAATPTNLFFAMF